MALIPKYKRLLKGNFPEHTNITKPCYLNIDTIDFTDRHLVNNYKISAASSAKHRTWHGIAVREYILDMFTQLIKPTLEALIAATHTRVTITSKPMYMLTRLQQSALKFNCYYKSCPYSKNVWFIARLEREITTHISPNALKAANAADLQITDFAYVVIKFAEAYRLRPSPDLFVACIHRMLITYYRYTKYRKAESDALDLVPDITTLNLKDITSLISIAKLTRSNAHVACKTQSRINLLEGDIFNIILQKVLPVLDLADLMAFVQASKYLSNIAFNRSFDNSLSLLATIILNKAEKQFCWGSTTRKHIARLGGHCIKRQIIDTMGAERAIAVGYPVAQAQPYKTLSQGIKYLSVSAKFLTNWHMSNLTVTNLQTNKETIINHDILSSYVLLEHIEISPDDQYIAYSMYTDNFFQARVTNIDATTTRPTKLPYGSLCFSRPGYILSWDSRADNTRFAETNLITKEHANLPSRLFYPIDLVVAKKSSTAIALTRDGMLHVFDPHVDIVNSFKICSQAERLYDTLTLHPDERKVIFWRLLETSFIFDITTKVLQPIDVKQWKYYNRATGTPRFSFSRNGNVIVVLIPHSVAFFRANDGAFLNEECLGIHIIRSDQLNMEAYRLSLVETANTIPSSSEAYSHAATSAEFNDFGNLLITTDAGIEMLQFSCDSTTFTTPAPM